VTHRPASWTTTNLGMVCGKGQYGWTTKAADHGIVKYLRTTDITKGSIKWQSVPYCQEVPPDREKYLIRADDILISRAGSVGFSVLISSPPSPTVFASYLIRYVPCEHVVPKFIAYFLRTMDYWDQIDIAASGIALANVNAAKLAEVAVPLAPLPEQARIADKLDTILARVDACGGRLDRLPTILKLFRQSVLAAATSGNLTENWRGQFPQSVDSQGLVDEIHAAHKAAGGHKAGNAAAPTEDVHDLSVAMFPKGWGLLTLRDVVLPDRPITYGILKPGPELEMGVPYVRVADFPGNKLNLATIRKTSPQMDEEFKRSRLRPGDLLLSIRGTVGRLVVIPDELAGANITQDSARLSVQSKVSHEYVLWYLRSSMAQDRMKGSTKGVAVRGINIGDVRALQLPFPSRAEQDEIVRRVEVLFALADRLEAHYTTARTQVEKLTPSLLAKAFRGDLVSQDPNDEPASALLARIGKQRGAQTSTKSKRGRKMAATSEP